MRRLLLSVLLCLLLPNAALAARLFNGSSDFAQSASALTLSGSSKLTIAFWLYWDTFGIDNHIALEYGAAAGSAGGAVVDPNDGTGDFINYVYDAGFTPLDFERFARPSAAAWHHYVITYDRSLAGGSQVIATYIDGVAATPIANGSGDVQSAWGDLVLNVMSRGGSSLFAAGRIAEVVFYSGYDFVQGDVDSLYNGGAGKDARTVQTPTYYWQLCGQNSPEPSLVGGINMTVSGASSATHPISGAGICREPYSHLALDEDPAQHNTTLADTGTGGNSGTLITNDGATNKSVSGKIVKGVTFDGVDDYINIAAFTTQSDPLTFTVTAWVKNVTGFGTLAAKGGTTDSSGWVIFLADNYLEAVTRDNLGNTMIDQAITGTTNLNDGAWHLISVVIAFDTVVSGNNSILLYIDGAVPAQSNTGGAVLPKTNTKPVTWATRTSSGDFHNTFLPGQIDDARIYNVGLSQAEIIALGPFAGGLFRAHGDLTGLGTGGKFHKDPLQYRPLRREIDYDLPDLAPLVR